MFRYDGIVLDALSPIEGFDGPILVSYKENKGRIDIIKMGLAVIQYNVQSDA